MRRNIREIREIFVADVVGVDIVVVQLGLDFDSGVFVGPDVLVAIFVAVFNAFGKFIIDGVTRWTKGTGRTHQRSMLDFKRTCSDFSILLNR